MTVKKFGLKIGTPHEGLTTWTFCGGICHVTTVCRIMKDGRQLIEQIGEPGKCTWLTDRACADALEIPSPERLPVQLLLALGLMVKVPEKAIVIYPVDFKTPFISSRSDFRPETHIFQVREWDQIKAGAKAGAVEKRNGMIVVPDGSTSVLVEKWGGWPGQHERCFTVTNQGGRAVIELARSSRLLLEAMLKLEQVLDRERGLQCEVWVAQQKARTTSVRRREEAKRNFAREQREFLKSFGLGHAAVSEIFNAAGPGCVRDAVGYFRLLTRTLPLSEIRSKLNFVLDGLGTSRDGDFDHWEAKDRMEEMKLPIPESGSPLAYFFYDELGRILAGAKAIAKTGGIPSSSSPT